MIAFVKLRILEPDADLALRGAILARVYLINSLLSLCH